MDLFEVKKKPIQCKTPIETLGLDERTTFLLKSSGMDSVEDLTLTSAAELVNEFLGIRTARLRQIRQKLAEKGLALRDDPKPSNERAA
jgi:DNA-directed RNA polymerase alpha subunit